MKTIVHLCEDNLAVPYISEDNLPVLHFSLFFSIFCEDNCTTATYFEKTIVLVLMKTIVHCSEDNCQLLIHREDNFTSEDNCTTVQLALLQRQSLD